MSYTVTITSQGQISIPAELRRKFSLTGGKNLVLRDTPEGQITIDPVPDLLELGGIFKKYAQNAKGKSFKKMREEYKNYRAIRFLKRGNFPFPHVSPT